MGTTINLFLEYKSHITNEWTAFGYGYYIPSNYEMFAKMAGVRNEKHNVLYVAKGFPKDATDYIKTEYIKASNYEGCCHNPSWLNKNEFADCVDTYDADKVDILEYKAILASMALFETYKCETRIIFWFEL